MSGGWAGTAAPHGGTSGGAAVATGGARLGRAEALAVAAVFVAMSAAFTLENGATAIDDLRGSGVPDHFVWSWEISSAICWTLLGWPVWCAVRVLRPPRLRWRFAIPAHLALTVLVSALHIAGMVALRKLAYLGWGEAYVFSDDLRASLIYEYRKDFVSYVQMALLFALVQWVFLRRNEAAVPAPPPGEGRVLAVVDSNVTHRVPVDAIDWVASAGNYVEIAWGERRLLHRSTLAGIAEALGDGFVRIHRGRLVRRAAIAQVETDRSGDFTVRLASGDALRGSRRYRDAL